MLTKITSDFWLDINKLVAVRKNKDNSYSGLINVKDDSFVTFSLDEHDGKKLTELLNVHYELNMGI